MSILSTTILGALLGQGDDLARENIAHNKAVLLDCLRSAGAHGAVVEYEGYGDSGDVTDVCIVGPDMTPMSILGNVEIHDYDRRYENGQWVYARTAHVLPVADALTRFAEAVVVLHHEGYENNDGGAGEVHFEVAPGHVRLEHRDYYTESIYTGTEL
ncbi:DUF6878 family protein [Burkholderia cepacia]|uniref:DUF6878 family protein n=1 Tax=Burkholderia cepacia TaxID=292 RepID=UPI001CF55FC5|nr:DUF6878 family protein [Burkholderia cepacia]MCA8355614.1 hypothetical protein [Burkholderia cepacia]